jgi:LysR family transcriptional regulator, glycine cleavage system transcriptional activator
LTSYWLLPLRKGARPAMVKAHKWLLEQAT